MRTVDHVVAAIGCVLIGRAVIAHDVTGAREMWPWRPPFVMSLDGGGLPRTAAWRSVAVFVLACVCSSLGPHLSVSTSLRLPSRFLVLQEVARALSLALQSCLVHLCKSTLRLTVPPRCSAAAPVHTRLYQLQLLHQST